MRKYPPVPILTRICNRATTFPDSNVRIPEGSFTIIPVIAIHHDSRIYPDPETFSPERFTPENISKRHPFSYLPFGEGPRICIGNYLTIHRCSSRIFMCSFFIGLRFGLLQTKIALISALTKFKFQLAPQTKVPLDLEVNGIIMTIKGGVHLIVKSR